MLALSSVGPQDWLPAKLLLSSRPRCVRMLVEIVRGKRPLSGPLPPPCDPTLRHHDHHHASSQHSGCSGSGGSSVPAAQQRKQPAASSASGSQVGPTLQEAAQQAPAHARTCEAVAATASPPQAPAVVRHQKHMMHTLQGTRNPLARHVEVTCRTAVGWALQVGPGVGGAVGGGACGGDMP